jgi:hypothetical protein
MKFFFEIQSKVIQEKKNTIRKMLTSLRFENSVINYEYILTY